MRLELVPDVVERGCRAIAALVGQPDRWAAWMPHVEAVLGAVGTDFRRQRRRLDLAMQFVDRYGKHLPSCATEQHEADDAECDCGLDDLLGSR